MKRKILALVTVVGMCCLIACGGEAKDDTNTDGNSGNEPVITEAPEPTKAPGSEVEPTAEPVQEATPEPIEQPVVEATPEPIVYEGIDMESDLPGEEWVLTFVDVIEEPKIVVFSDETGRKEIFENDCIVKFNPDTDRIGVYLPEGYKRVDKTAGIKKEEGFVVDYFVYFKLIPEESRDNGPQMSAFYVEYNGEEIEVPFVFVPE